MLARRGWLLAMILLPLGMANGQATEMPLAGLRPALVLEGLGKSTVPLHGPWSFHEGDDLRWKQPGWQDADWARLTADEPWGQQGFFGYHGYAWYRLRIRVTPSPGVPRQFALLVPPIGDAYELYWNGDRMGSSGRLPPHPVWQSPTAVPEIFLLEDHRFGLHPNEGNAEDLAGDAEVLEGLLAVRVWKAPPLSDDSGLEGGFAGAPVLGSPDGVRAYKNGLDYVWLRGHLLAFAEYLLYAILGMVGLFGWLRDRKRWLFFWMTGFSVAPILRLLLFGLRLPWPVAFANGFGEPVSTLRDVSLWYLLLYLLELRDQPKLVRATLICAYISLASTTVDGLLLALDASARGYGIVQMVDAACTAVYFLTAALPLVLVAKAVSRYGKLDARRWLVAATAALSGMVQVVQLIAPQGQRFTHWTLAETMASPLFHVGGNGVTPATLTGLLLLAAIVYAVYCSSLEAYRRQSELEQELDSARELQQVLIPAALPSVPGYSISSAYRPAQEVGGDFFQILPLADGRTMVLVGDVSGKGLKAAMSVSFLVGLIRSLADRFDTPPGPGLLLTELNRRLYGRLQHGFTTCIALALEADGKCTLASAGHPAPYRDAEEIELPGAFPLGILAAVPYEERCLTLQIGQRLALYTDGLPEARSQSGELFGFRRAGELLATDPNALGVSEAAAAFGQDDDITVVILTRVRNGEETSTLETLPSKR